MQNMTIISRKSEQRMEHTLTISLNSCYDWGHAGTVQPKLHWVQDQAGLDYRGELGELDQV